MFNRFISAYECTEERPAAEISLNQESNLSCIKSVLNELGGKTFNEGLYRVLLPSEIEQATNAARLAFPELAERITVFGYDWLGRKFAVDTGRLSKGVEQVLMLEVGAGEAMQIPADPIAFHNNELVEFPDDALAKPFFEEWKMIGKKSLCHDQCVGYKIPLFLGGADEISNLEISDLSIYWHVCGQLRNKTWTLPEGHSISDIKIR